MIAFTTEKPRLGQMATFEYKNIKIIAPIADIRILRQLIVEFEKENTNV